MDCKTASMLMMEFIDGEINELGKNKLYEHLDKCKDCSEEFSLLTDSLDMIDSLDELDPPEGIEDLVLSRIDTKKYKSEKRSITKALSIILGLFTAMSGYLLYTFFRNPYELKEVLIVNIIKLLNFTVLTLPKILSIIEDNFILLSFIGISILTALFSSLLLVAITEVYFIKKSKLILGGSHK